MNDPDIMRTRAQLLVDDAPSEITTDVLVARLLRSRPWPQVARDSITRWPGCRISLAILIRAGREIQMALHRRDDKGALIWIGIDDGSGRPFINKTYLRIQDPSLKPEQVEKLARWYGQRGAIYRKRAEYASAIAAKMRELGRTLTSEELVSLEKAVGGLDEWP